MKFYLIKYPFPINEDVKGESQTADLKKTWYHPTMRDVLKDAKDRFQTRDELEDMVTCTEPALSRGTAKVFEIDTMLLRSHVCDLLNGGSFSTPEKTPVANLLYRHGKIVVQTPAGAVMSEPADEADALEEVE